MKKLLLLLTVLIFVAGCSRESTTAPATTTEATAPAATTTETASAVPTAETASPAATTDGAAAEIVCPTGCYMMNCPPPGGPAACCKKVNGIYQVCPQ